MSEDETIISNYEVRNDPVFRVTVEDDQTVIRDYATNAPRFRINGKIGGGSVEVMTTEERTAITPEAGQLIYDSTLGILFVGDGSTQGGTAVGGGGGGGVVPGYRLTDDGTAFNFNPVQPIVSVTGNSVTLAPDTAYKIYATTGAFNVTANPPAANYWGLEGHAEIFVGSVGYVVFDTSKIVLANQLEPDSVNNCTLRFHDGMCYISVEDHIAGYIVVNGSTAGSGSLYYGITTSTNDYVAFDASLNGTTIPLAGATAEGEKHVVGNGYTSTALTGAVDCGTSKFTVANLGLNNVQVVGGTLTLGDVYIPNGATVAVSGGGLAVEKVVGAGESSVIDLGGTFVSMESGHAVIDGCVISGGYNSSTNGGAFLLNGTPVFELKNAVVTSNSGAGRGAFALNQSAELTMSSTVMSGNSGVVGLEDLLVNGGCTCTLQGGCTVGNAGIGGSLVISGSNVIANVTSGYTAGSVTLTSGATLDLTGNTNPTPIAPGGGIVFKAGGATVKYTSGGSAFDALIAGGTYASIGNDGTVNIALSGFHLFGTGDTSNTKYVTTGLGFAIAGGATLTVRDCSFIGGDFSASASNSTGVMNLSGRCKFSHSIVIGGTNPNGTVNLADNSVLDFTGATPAASNPLVIVTALNIGTGCSVVLVNGTTVALTSGTYTTLNRDGTLV